VLAPPPGEDEGLAARRRPGFGEDAMYSGTISKTMKPEKDDEKGLAVRMV
jgi:hypothetical protein